MRYEAIVHAYVGAFVDELTRAGVRHAVVCPGSRSTPLALTLAADRRLRLWMHYDERAAAYFALGIGKATGQPAAVLCTSGTAAANFLPAIVEARLARVPLLAITADRPPELRDVGAPQTIDQVRLYGEHVKWFADTLLPEASDEALRYVRTLAARAVATTLANAPGPVHLNMPFREPLVPVAEPSANGTADVARVGRADGAPYVRVRESRRSPDARLVEALAADLAGVRRGLIVCGPQDDPALAPAVAQLADALDFPILADPLSGVRCGRHGRRMVVDAYDALLREPAFVDEMEPSIVLRFGAIPTSKPVLQYLERHAGARQILVDGAGGWNEPTALAAEVIHADSATLCGALAEILAVGRLASPPLPLGEGRGEGVANRRDWCSQWLTANRAARAAIAAELASIDEPFEGRVLAELADLLPDGSTLVVGNSMPVRDLDTFFPSSERTVRLLSNRGANGIDGVVSTALGAAAALSGPVVLAIGDLSFYHDMNGLLAARLHGLDLTIVLLNNDGGGIFSFLSQAAHPEHFEQLFGTPHGLDFRPAVEMYGGRFERTTSWPDFRAAAAAALAIPGLKVIEVPTERARNVVLHRRVWPAVSRALAEVRTAGAAS